jgi:hypothetical protein
MGERYDFAMSVKRRAALHRPASSPEHRIRPPKEEESKRGRGKRRGPRVSPIPLPRLVETSQATA